MEWHPLLTGALRDQALERAAALTRSLTPPPGPGQRSDCLAAGSAGLAVCHAVAAGAGLHERAGEQAAACLDRAIDALASRPLGPSLYSGFTGIAWAADLVGRLLPGETADRGDDVDLALARALPRYPGAGPYDLIDGLAGIGVYALARWPRQAAADCLTGALARLTDMARHDSDGVYWFTPASALAGPRRELYPDGGVDLGLAHGMAAILPLLARACAIGTAGSAVRALLDGAVGWLMAHLVDTPAGGTVPAFVAAGCEPTQARSAWCYGDAGVAIALLLAARDAGEPGWARAGLDLAVRAAGRTARQCGVTEPGLCHGAAGLGHLFNRMYQLTGEPELRDAAVSWLQRTLQMCAGGSTGIGPGLLEGAAGIALALLAACLPAEPGWDQMLLVSTGPGVTVSAT